MLNETFETSITGHPSDITSNRKQYINKRPPVCTNPDHQPLKCVECEAIENDLTEEKFVRKEEVNNEAIDGNVSATEVKEDKLMVQPTEKGDNENAWQVGHIEKYDTLNKLNVSPITITSTRDDEPSENQTLKKFTHENAENDSTSFVILRDCSHDIHFLPNIRPNRAAKVLNENHCASCCFCHPHLHQNSPKTCNFCSTNSHRETPLSNASQPHNKLNAPTDSATGRSSTAPSERIYESSYKSNHTHVRTKCKDSDTVSTKCTRSNRRVRRFTDDNANDETDNNAMHKESNKSNSKKFPAPTTIKKDSNVNINSNDKTSSIPKLPPYDWSSNSFDTSPTCSSLSTSSSSHSCPRRQNSKSVPNLPTAERWQNISRKKDKFNDIGKQMRNNSRYQEFYRNDVNGNKEKNKAEEQILDNRKGDKSKSEELPSKNSGKF